MSSDRSGPQSGYARPQVLGLPTNAASLMNPGAPPRERADAARNRLRILAAAEDLFSSRGVDAVTMDDIAAAAEVGKGTLYRRFGDKGGLAASLLSERGRELQERILAGDPPLGPGAPPLDRLNAFVAAYLEFQVQHLQLVLLSETSPPGARLRKGSYAFWCQHCTFLLREAGAPHAELRAEFLLAGLSAEQVHHWVHNQGRRPEDLGTALVGISSSLGAQ